VSDLKNTYKEKALAIAQKYLGMTPKDLGCDNWAEMNEKLADEIVSLVNKNKIMVVGSGAMDAEMAIAHLSKTMSRDFSAIDIHDIGQRKSNFGVTNDVNYLLTDVAKIKTEDLLGKTKMLKNEFGEMEEEGTRGVTNNRKTKKRKKAKNGKHKK
jgi:hypothetical protein